MVKCYLCNDELNKKNKSIEHIIPESLGGKLTSENLLCIKCNSKLGRDVDAKFVSSFEPLICTLNIFGRENKKAIECKILTSGGFREGLIIDKKIVPKQPFFERNGKNVKYYGTKKILNQFQNVIKKDAEKDKLTLSDLNIKIVDDLRCFFQVDFNIDNTNFYQSLTKIALNFSIHSGVPKEAVKNLISSTEKEFNSALILSYVPLIEIECILEKVRNYIDSNFPNHNLILFTERLTNGKKMILCFVELFSTFQYYVMLSDQYEGDDIFETYSQKVLKEEGYQYRVNENALNHKSILPDFQSLKSLHPTLNLNFKDPKKLKRIMKTYLSQPDPYVLNYSEHLRSIFDQICLPLVALITDKKIGEYVNKEVINELKKEPPEILEKAYFQMHKHYYILTEDDNNFIVPKVMRRAIIGEGGKLLSVFSKLSPEYSYKHKQEIREYCHHKFNGLMTFVNKRFLELKQKK